MLKIFTAVRFPHLSFQFCNEYVMAMLKDDYEESIIDAEIKVLKNKSFNLGENKLYNNSFPHLSCQF